MFNYLKSYFRKFNTNMIFQSNTKDEMIIIVDNDDNPLYSTNRKEMRMKNLTHRATAIFVNSDNKILVHKRSSLKEYCLSYLDLCFGGVVGQNETDLFLVKFHKISLLKENFLKKLV